MHRMRRSEVALLSEEASGVPGVGCRTSRTSATRETRTRARKGIQRLLCSFVVVVPHAADSGRSFNNCEHHHDTPIILSPHTAASLSWPEWATVHVGCAPRLPQVRVSHYPSCQPPVWTYIMVGSFLHSPLLIPPLIHLANSLSHLRYFLPPPRLHHHGPACSGCCTDPSRPSTASG